MHVDISNLNCHVYRERYQWSVPAQAVADIAATNTRYITVLDTLKDYYQCPLDPES